MTKITFEIITLLKKYDWISGEDMANKLQISRTAVWKHIQKLKKKGYDIIAKTNKGYHLKKTPNNITTDELKHVLKTQLIGSNIYHFTSIHSTNNYAKSLAKNAEPEGTIVIADRQTKGRGRKQRLWESPKGGLWFSILLRPKIPPSEAMKITMCAACAIVESIKKHTSLKPSIKWPNDILIDKRKVCGILTELSAEIDVIDYLIVGIGLNVNNSVPKNLEKISTTLKNESKKPIKIQSLFIGLIEYFDQFYKSLMNGNDNLIRKKWRSYSSTIGASIQINNETKIITGIAVDIGNHGELIVQTSNGKKQIITGDISYL